ncbi:hypothetical protein IFM89_003177, partial [Coptis chinensis]
ISNGHVTSYKPKVYWQDDKFEEVLYTVPGELDSMKGGIGLVLNEVSQTNSKGTPLCTLDWIVANVDADSIDALQKNNDSCTTEHLLCSIILQGKGLEYWLIRMGYEDIYLASPGSSSQKFGDGYFICIGPASMLVPIIVNPGEDWRGAQVIEHDNL